MLFDAKAAYAIPPHHSIMPTSLDRRPSTSTRGQIRLDGRLVSNVLASRRVLDGGGQSLNAIHDAVGVRLIRCPPPPEGVGGPHSSAPSIETRCSR